MHLITCDYGMLAVIHGSCWIVSHHMELLSLRDELVRQMESVKEKIEASSLLPPGEETR